MTLEAHTEFLSVDTPEGPHRMAWQCWQKSGMDDAPLLVCVHGLTRNRHDFDIIAAAMTGHYRVITVDILGRGDSDYLKDASHYGYPLYVSLMLQLLNHLKEETGETSVDWLGTSMGGLIGMMIAAQPHSPVARLILNDIGPYIPLQGLQRLAEYVGKAPLFTAASDVEEYIRIILSGFGPLTDAQWQHLARYAAAKNESGRWRMRYDPRIAMAFEGLSSDIDLQPVWSAVRCPVLVLRGENSDLLSAATVADMCSRPATVSATFADTGHAPALMCEEQISVIRDFLVM